MPTDEKTLDVEEIREDSGPQWREAAATLLAAAAGLETFARERKSRRARHRWMLRAADVRRVAVLLERTVTVEDPNAQD